MFRKPLNKIIINKRLGTYVWWNNMILKESTFIMIFTSLGKINEIEEYLDEFLKWKVTNNLE